MKSMIEALGYPGIVVLVFVENVFPPIPSELIIPFGGFLVAEGEMTFVGVVLAGTLGSVLGALPLYYLGHYWNRARMKRFFAGKGKWLMVKEENVDRAYAWFERRGSWTVFVCRMVPGLRSYISIPAGSAGMPMPKFLALTAAGTMIWTSLLAWAGRMLGGNYDRISHFTEVATWTVSVLVLGIILWWIVRRWRRRSC